MFELLVILALVLAGLFWFGAGLVAILAPVTALLLNIIWARSARRQARQIRKQLKE